MHRTSPYSLGRKIAVFFVAIFITQILSVAVFAQSSAVIRRTSHGIPHITAKNYASFGFGDGYTFAQDHLCSLADQVIKVRGEHARFFGAGENNKHLNSDVTTTNFSDLMATAVPPKADVLREGFVFYLKDFKMEHHEETHLLHITVRYDFVKGINEKDYPDFVPMVKFVEKFLTEYPNENSYWEIVNKQLTQRLLAENPALASVTCELEVPPSQRFKFTRSSIVTRERHANRPPGKQGKQSK